MSTHVSLAAEPRSDRGKGAARKLRAAGRVPAVIYGRGRDPESLSLSRSEVDKLFGQHVGGSTVIDLAVDGKDVQVLIRDVQRHPLAQTVQHVDFLEVHAGQTVTVDVPIHLVGTGPGVRNSGGTLEQSLRTVHLSVMPRHIPAHIDLDVSMLEVGQSLHVSDLTVENAELLSDPGATICTVIAPRIDTEAEAAGDEEPVEEGAEPELIRKPKAEDEGTEGEG